jgi:DNA repair exonuclease SbcCD ATPase subunit
MCRKKIIPLFIGGSLLILAGLPAQRSTARQRLERSVRQSIDIRQATQKSEEQWRMEKEKLVAHFEQLQQKEKLLAEQKKELSHQIESARGRINAKEKQLADIEEISSQIPPFINELFNALKSQVTDGQPFLMDERQKRIQRLESVVNDPDVDISEKYRKVMEALLVEAEYGFTIEAYQETITIDGQALLADIFRLGRISLFYQNLDRKRCGFYNTADGTWQSLDSVHNAAIQSAIDIAAKRRPIELLSLPVGRMVAQ